MSRRTLGLCLLLILASGCRSHPQAKAQMLVEQLQAHPGGQAIKSLALAPDGHLLATCSEDKSIKLWDLATGKQVRVIEEEQAGFYTPTFSPDGNMLAATDVVSTFSRGYNHLDLWNLATGERQTPLDTSYASSIKFNPAGTLVALGGTLHLSLVDVHTFQIVHDLGGPHKLSNSTVSAINALDFSPDGSLLATAGHEGIIKVWQVPDLMPFRTFSAQSSVRPNPYPSEEHAPPQTVSVVFSHDGSLLAANTQEGTVYVWEANSGREVGRYAFKYDRKSEIPATLVHSLFFTPNDEWLVTTDQSGRAIRLLNATTGKEMSTPIRIDSDSWMVALDGVLPDGTMALAFRRRAAGDPAPPKEVFQVWKLDLP